MALAILKYLESANGQHIFEADIGTNSYYQFRIGKEHTKIRGLDVVDGIAHQSGMIKPPTIDPSGFNTRFRLQVPANLFNRNARYIQLTSFKTPGQRAPALSDVVAVLPALVDIHDDYKLPKIMAPQRHMNRKQVKSPLKVRPAG